MERYDGVREEVGKNRKEDEGDRKEERISNEIKKNYAEEFGKK